MKLSQDQFYLQDSRDYVGNDMLFHAIDGKGYTTDMRKAHVFTRDQAVAHHNLRSTDIPWPKDYIDARTRPAVDMQYVKRDEALAGTGIVLMVPKRQCKEAARCHRCGSFVSEEQYYTECPRCFAENRP